MGGCERVSLEEESWGAGQEPDGDGGGENGGEGRSPPGPGTIHGERLRDWVFDASDVTQD